MTAKYDFFNSEKRKFPDLKKWLGEHFNKIDQLFRVAFKLIDLADLSGVDVFVVFVARRCFILACIFLRSLIPSIGEEKYLFRQKRVYSDGGLRILAKELARKFFRNDSYSCKIFLFDDIMIHGRAIGGLLSSAEDIFAQEYISLREINPGRGKGYTKSELYDKFLDFIIIKSCYISTQPNLLRERYKSRIDNENTEYAEPQKWRSASNKISNLIFNSPIPNAAFVPGLLFNHHNSLNKERIYNSFFVALDSKQSSTLCDWIYIRNEYKGRKMDSYMVTIPSYNSIHSVFTIRCTDHYVMPFVFLPVMDNSRIIELEKNIILTLDGREYEDTLPLYRVFRELRRIDKLSNMYTELITMVYSVSLLRSFIEEIGCEEYFENNQSLNDYLLNSTTLPIIMGNFAHDQHIEELIRYLLNPMERPLFTIDQICDIVTGNNNNERLILDSSYYSFDRSLDTKDTEKLIDILERVIFRYGMDSEIEAYRLSTGSFAPSYDSVEYFYFPRNNYLEKVIRVIYQEDKEWMSQNASVYDVFSFILQMMDYGCLALITGTHDKQKLYMQCLKAGEQSLNVEASKIAIALPLMNEIEGRCFRKGRPTYEAFDQELRYFNSLADYYLDENDSKELHAACDLLSDSEKLRQIKAFEKGLYKSRHRSKDYYFALDEYFKNEMSAAEYRKECENFYYLVIYC